MAANASAPPEGNETAAGSGHTHDPGSLEPTIEALLGQQAEINTKLGRLLPRTYGLNVRAELANLRHKLRVLRTFADDHRTYFVPLPFLLLPPTKHHCILHPTLFVALPGVHALKLSVP